MHIFHLEDDVLLGEILQVMLCAASPQVKLEQVLDSDAALAYINQHQNSIDLYILDIRVPGELDGLQVAEKIRALGIERPIVITSAYRRPSSDFMTKHQLEWMSKPWHLVQMPEHLLELAKQPHS